MNILHYSLGFPPFRRGGMTKYCIDLIEQQLKLGHNVAMLWPGRIKKYGYEIKINKSKDEKINNDLLCKSYEIINPLPVSLLNGISNFEAFTQSKDESVFYSFFKEKEIEVIHIHTLMGLPKECIDVAKKLNIKLIYTTHDYFGLCPKWGLINKGKICDDDFDCKKCVECNKTALSLNKIKILQSNTYKYIKDSKFISIIRNKYNDNLYEESNNDSSAIFKEEEIEYSKKYKNLRKFYISMLEKIDLIHFNSYNTEKIFNKYFSTMKNGKVISITHGSISDNKKIREYNKKLNIGYLGPITEHKGFFNLKKVCDEIYKCYKDKFKLHIFAEYTEEVEYIVKHKPYKYSQLEEVMNSIDILIVPSLWNETFGFTVLEALSYGVPVIVSENVGAKDLLDKYKSGIIYDNIDELEKELRKILLNPKEILSKINQYIVSNVEIKDINKHNEEIMNLYKNI